MIILLKRQSICNVSSAHIFDDICYAAQWLSIKYNDLDEDDIIRVLEKDNGIIIDELSKGSWSIVTHLVPLSISFKLYDDDAHNHLEKLTNNDLLEFYQEYLSENDYVSNDVDTFVRKKYASQIEKE